MSLDHWSSDACFQPGVTEEEMNHNSVPNKAEGEPEEPDIEPVIKHKVSTAQFKARFWLLVFGDHRPNSPALEKRDWLVKTGASEEYSNVS